jgi:TonB family protein
MRTHFHHRLTRDAVGGWGNFLVEDKVKSLLVVTSVVALFGILVSSEATAASSDAAVPSAARPVSIPAGRTQLCTSFYPTKLKEAGIGGVVLLSVHIAIDGSISQARVAQSSGNADLDAASLECSKVAWMYKIMAGGEAGEIDWQARIDWKPSGAVYFSKPRLAGEPACSGYYPRNARRQGETGEVWLTYVIGEDGSTRDIRVERSSGTDSLDSAGIDCISHWKFAPATQNGTPVELAGSAGVRFSQW